MLTCVSLVELSVHCRSIREDDAADAVRLVGAFGGGGLVGVVASAMFDGSDARLPLKAMTRYRYVVPARSDWSAYDVAFAAAVVSCAKLEHPAPWHRSILNSVSSLELSVQLKSMAEAEAGSAARLPGAAGFDGGVAPQFPILNEPMLVLHPALDAPAS